MSALWQVQGRFTARRARGAQGERGAAWGQAPPFGAIGRIRPLRQRAWRRTDNPVGQCTMPVRRRMALALLLVGKIAASAQYASEQAVALDCVLPSTVPAASSSQQPPEETTYIPCRNVMMRHAGQHPDRLGEVAQRLSPKQTLAATISAGGCPFPERTAPEPP